LPAHRFDYSKQINRCNEILSQHKDRLIELKNEKHLKYDIPELKKLIATCYTVDNVCCDKVWKVYIKIIDIVDVNYIKIIMIL
jgi:hypothetical protein